MSDGKRKRKSLSSQSLFPHTEETLVSLPVDTRVGDRIRITLRCATPLQRPLVIQILTLEEYEERLTNGNVFVPSGEALPPSASPPIQQPDIYFQSYWTMRWFICAVLPDGVSLEVQVLSP